MQAIRLNNGEPLSEREHLQKTIIFFPFISATHIKRVELKVARTGEMPSPSFGMGQYENAKREGVRRRKGRFGDKFKNS